MTSSSNALTTADALWRHLTEHQPAVAAALAMQARALPEDWSQRLLGVARTPRSTCPRRTVCTWTSPRTTPPTRRTASRAPTTVISAGSTQASPRAMTPCTGPSPKGSAATPV